MKPSRLFISLCAVWLVAALCLGIADALGAALPSWLSTFWWSALLALCLISGLDAFGLRAIATPEVTRKLPGNLSLGYWSDIRLTISHRFKTLQQVRVFDHVPQDLEYENVPFTAALKPGQHTECAYKVRPLKRGQFQFPRCELWLNSPIKLWQSRRLVEVSDNTRVYPDFARLYGAELMGIDHWLNQLGVRQAQRRGLGLEFHQLREFRNGDSLRQIDWKATARKHTLISREYQDERDQQIVFLIDCGRRMRSQDAELSHFDHSLNATLLLSYIALRQGDAVGLATFAGEEVFVPAQKGQAHLNTLLNAVYDLQSTQRPADYATAITSLLSRLKRRALVILITNLRDEDNEQLLASTKRLSLRHRLLIASLRDDVLDQIIQQPVQEHSQALLYCGTQDYLLERNRLHTQLTAHGMPVLEARPSELGPELVNQYLAWKKAGSL